MSQPANEGDGYDLEDMLSRLEWLEEKLEDALGTEEEHHPELLAKEISALRGMVAAHADVLYGLSQEVAAMRASL